MVLGGWGGGGGGGVSGSEWFRAALLAHRMQNHGNTDWFGSSCGTSTVLSNVGRKHVRRGRGERVRAPIPLNPA